MSFAVVADTFEPLDFDLLADVFRSVLGLAAYDAKHRARRSRGIVVDDVNAAEAAAIKARLQPTIRAVVVDVETIPPLDRPRRVRRLDLAEGSLGVFLGYGDEVSHVPWDHVTLLSGGVVRVDEQVVEDGLDLTTGGGGEEGPMLWRSNVRREVRDDVMLEAVIRVGGDESFLHLRMSPHELVYSEILGEQAVADPRRNAREESFHNFRGVVAILGRRATKAVVTPATVALVSDGDAWIRPPAEARFAEADEFRAFNRWQVARSLPEV